MSNGKKNCHETFFMIAAKDKKVSISFIDLICYFNKVRLIRINVSQGKVLSKTCSN